MTSPDPLLLVSLVCERDVPLALECLASFKDLCGQRVRLHFFEDGTLSETSAGLLLAAFPAATLTSRSELDARAEDLLRGRPHCREHRSTNPTMLKIIDLPAWFVGESFLFCDCDVLFLRPFSLEAYREKAPRNFVFMRDRKEAYSARILRLALDRRLRMPSRLNSGLMSIPPGRHDLDFLEWFLAQRDFCLFPQVLEQTAWAAMTHHRDVLFFDPAQVVCASVQTRRTPETVAIHFPSRFKEQIPAYRGARSHDGAPIDLRLVQPARLDLQAALVNGFRNRFGQW
jgi:hypothetical protein